MNNIISTINSPQLQHLLLPIKILFIVFSLVLFCIIIYFLATTQYLRYLFLEEWQELVGWRRAHRKKRKKVKEREEPKEIEIKARETFEKEEAGPVKTKMSEWERIEKRIERGGRLGYKLALLDADKFLNRVLGELKIQGEDLDEKLDNMPQGFVSNIEELKEARRFINRVLEDEKTEVEKEKAQEILKQFKKALMELKTI
jgi:hypothetical protein